jgi:Flp pilus assembly protein TadD
MMGVVLSPEEQLQQLKAEGKKLHTSGDLEGAEELYRQCLEMDPNNAAVLANLAMLYLTQGKGEAALRASEEVLAQDEVPFGLVLKAHWR